MIFSEETSIGCKVVHPMVKFNRLKKTYFRKFRVAEKTLIIRRKRRMRVF